MTSDPANTWRLDVSDFQRLRAASTVGVPCRVGSSLTLTAQLSMARIKRREGIKPADGLLDDESPKGQRKSGFFLPPGISLPPSFFLSFCINFSERLPGREKETMKERERDREREKRCACRHVIHFHKWLLRSPRGK